MTSLATESAGRSSQPRADIRFLFIAITVVAIVVYGSLFPFSFRNDVELSAIPRMLLSTSGMRASRGDLLANVLLYIPLGFACVKAFGSRVRLPIPPLLAVGGGFLLSTAIESAQVYCIGRTPALSDIYTNTGGAFLGALAASFVRVHVRFTRIAHLTRRPFPVLLMGCWLGYRLFPYVPVIDLSKYWNAIKPLVRDPQLTFLAVYRHTFVWLALGIVLDALAGPRRSRVGLFVLIGSVLSLRIVITGIVLSWAEVAGAAIAFFAFSVLSLGRIRTIVVAVGFLIVVILQGLEPFDFLVEPRPFGWVPFLSFMRGSLDANVPSFFEKVFTYGMLQWLLIRTGLSLSAAAVLGGCLVFSLRLLQIYIPGRSAEITDVVILLAMTALMKLLREDGSEPTP